MQLSIYALQQQEYIYFKNVTVPTYRQPESGCIIFGRLQTMITKTIYYLVYVSAAVDLLSEAELLEILELSRKNNARHGITGILLYHDGNFMQYIEGEEHEIKHLYYDIIAKDPRHQQLLVIDEGEHSEKVFEGFAMSFRNLSKGNATQIAGFNGFMRRTEAIPANQGPEQSGVLTLLLSFRETART
jgi:hypothetical protein